MKGNRILQIAVPLLFITIFAQAQFKNVGAGLAYGTEIEKPGLIINGQYFFSEKFALSPSFIFYRPTSEKTSFFGVSSEIKSTVWELNADANYYFFDQGVKLFGIGGLNLTGVKTKVKTTTTSVIPGFSGSGESSASDTNVGINLGIGADFKVDDKIVPFALIKYTANDFDQLVLVGGVRFMLK